MFTLSIIYFEIISRDGPVQILGSSGINSNYLLILILMKLSFKYLYMPHQDRFFLKFFLLRH